PAGTLAIAANSSDAAVLDDLYRFQQKLGLAVDKVTAREARKLEPALAPTIRGGLFVPHDHQVDNRRLTAALLVACGRTGVDTIAERVRAIAVDDNVVELANGDRVGFDQLALAAGCW